MVATTAGKPFPIEGLCQANSVSTAGLVLNYTPTTNTKAFTIDWGNVSGGQPHFDALRNVTLVNNSCATTAGCGSSASGIFIGTTNGGCPKCTFTNVNIEGFNIGFEIPSGAAGTGWGIGFNRFNFAYNATGFSGLNTSGMENLNFTSGTFIVNGTGMTTKGEVYAVGVSFDGNTTTAVNLPNNGLLTPGPDFSCFGCHFENPTGSPAVPHYITGTGNFSLYGGILEDDTSAVHTIDYMVQAQGAWFLIDGVQAVINQTGANTTITSLVSAGANVRGQVRFILGGNPTLPITYISGTTAGVTNLSYNQNTSNGLTPWKLEAPLTAPIGIGSAVFTPNATTGLHVRIPGNSIDAIRMEDTDNSKTVDCGPGIGGGGVFACRDVGGARQIWQYAYASPFLTTLAGGLATTRVATSPGIITDTIKASGTAPTCTFTSGGGTSPSCTVDTGSADLAGIIIATTGTGAPALTGTITLTFSGNYGANKPVCTYTLSLNGAGQWGALATVMDKTPAVGSDLFTWTNATGATPAGVALSTSTAYWINYNCVGK